MFPAMRLRASRPTRIAQHTRLSMASRKMRKGRFNRPFLMKLRLKDAQGLKPA
jgi:hypothetical protein